MAHSLIYFFICLFILSLYSKYVLTLSFLVAVGIRFVVAPGDEENDEEHNGQTHPCYCPVHSGHEPCLLQLLLGVESLTI